MGLERHRGSQVPGLRNTDKSKGPPFTLGRLVLHHVCRDALWALLDPDRHGLLVHTPDDAGHILGHSVNRLRWGGVSE